MGYRALYAGVQDILQLDKSWFIPGAAMLSKVIIYEEGTLELSHDTCHSQSRQESFDEFDWMCLKRCIPALQNVLDFVPCLVVYSPQMLDSPVVYQFINEHMHDATA